MDALLASFSLVALAEIGDKTQLLSILLAARFRRFWPIILGILLATLVNHAFSAYAGSLLVSFMGGIWPGLITGLLFIIVGLWALIPDKEPDNCPLPRHGAFLATTIAFFFAEIGDKTQLATITLGAQYADLLMVTLGSTAGMLAANIPAVLLGDKILKLVPLNAVRITASLLFIACGVYALYVQFGN